MTTDITPLPYDHAEVLGGAIIACLALLSACLLLLRLRDHFREAPDPKLTYATLLEHNKLRDQLVDIQHETKNDIERLRAENKADHEELDRRRSQSIAGVHELIRKNAEHIASLIAHNQLAQQRLAELSIKVDKLATRAHHE